MSLQRPPRSLVEELEQVSSKLFMTNVVGNIDLFKFLLPPIMKVEGKKVIAISSSHADFDFVYNLEVETRFLYSASKTALNAIVAKFNAQYKKDGALFMSMSRGVVEVDQFNNVRSDQMQGLMSFVGKIVIYVPDFSGTTLVGDTIPIIKSIWEKASIESGSSGASVSHHGTKQWI
ncbi:hypothetical protein G6011_00975 [Alternaria panax]|uniref:Uncharacterized protein n=1 Tax=Alternaria panax TaxID=48097 RepID=A0AAD4IJW2_9PLEO|nr:hypothetical protein G6011_00975 [Alternaria panax]